MHLVFDVIRAVRNFNCQEIKVDYEYTKVPTKISCLYDIGNTDNSNILFELISMMCYLLLIKLILKKTNLTAKKHSKKNVEL